MACCCLWWLGQGKVRYRMVACGGKLGTARAAKRPAKKGRPSCLFARRKHTFKHTHLLKLKGVSPLPRPLGSCDLLSIQVKSTAKRKNQATHGKHTHAGTHEEQERRISRGAIEKGNFVSTTKHQRHRTDVLARGVADFSVRNPTKTIPT